MDPADGADERPSTVVLGLDGAGFDLLEPWMAAGELPNLRRAIESGVAGELRSVLPPVTSPNWKAYATGKNPGKLGIFWWFNVDTEHGRSYRPADRYHEQTEFWELIGAAEPAGVLGVPTTYPPKAGDHLVISGAPDAENTGYTNPAELEAELRRRFDYRVTKRRRVKEDVDRACEEVLDLIDLRFAVGKRLLAERDLAFLQCTTFYINLLHHHLWDHEYTLRGWRIIDDHLGDLLDDGHDVVLMSDHGHNEIDALFRVNHWLEREGYLAYDTQVADALLSVGIHSDRLKRLVNGLDRRLPGIDLRDLATRYAPSWFLDRLPSDTGELGGSKATNADWDRTVAIASAQGPIYLTLDRDDPGYDDLREELIGKLEALTDPDGNPVADAVRRVEEVYDGPYLDEAPDIVVDQADGVHISEKFGRGTVFAREDDVWAGVNKREGLFVATGPSFATGTVEEMSILDLAPTLLRLHGRSVPADMDGRVREEVFADGFEPGERSAVRGAGRGSR